MTGWRTIMALAGASLATPLAAQDYTPVPPQIDGEIGEADRLDGQGRRFDDYALDLGRGDAIVVSASPASGSRLEPAIEIYPGDAARPLASDGADPGSRAARLSFTAPQAGLFRIRVLGGTAAAGRYTLRFRRAQARGPGFAIGGVTGNVVAPPVAPATPGPQDGSVTRTGGPLSRFIICPGHRRCPR